MASSLEANNAESFAAFVPESPFLETPWSPSTETEAQDIESRLLEADSPFLHERYSFEPASPMEAEFSQLLAEMYDESFNDVVREMGAEAISQNLSQFSAEVQENAASMPQAERFLNEHFAPLAERAESMLEQFAEALGRYDVRTLTEAEIDRIAEQFHPTEGEAAPLFEQFLGKLWNKAKSLAKGALNLAKKGIGALAKFGLGPILKKLKQFVWPLLKRVIQFAIGKLPSNLRPLAQKLASKLLGSQEMENLEPELQEALPAAATGEHVQFEFDIQAAQLLFAADEAEMEEFTTESVGASQEYSDPPGDMYKARERLIAELSALRQGESPAPAIQNFLPVAMLALRPIAKVALSIIGRDKVVNFLAQFLAKLIQRFIGQEGATLLSRAVADAGLRLIGLEVSDQSRERISHETLASTLEQTVTNLMTQPEYTFENETLLEAAALEAFEGAVQANFPGTLLKPDLQVTSQAGENGTFVMMPRNRRRKYYKKYFPVKDIEIQRPAVSSGLKTFGQATLEDFFSEQLLLPPNKAVKAKLHIYEAICGTWLGHISQMETNVSGLGHNSRRAYYQFHPLTTEAALAFGVPGLGINPPPEYLAGREAIAIGQRLYYLELPGSRTLQPGSYVRIEIDLKKLELRLYIYFSEKRCQEISQQLRTSGTVAGGMQVVKELLGTFIDTVKRRSAGRAVKVIRETLEPEQLTLPSVASVINGARSAAGAVGSAVARAVSATAGAGSAVAGAINQWRGTGATSNMGAGVMTGGVSGGAAGAIGGAVLDWLVGKVLDWANMALGKWLVDNKDLFIKQTSDPSKKGVTIIVTYTVSQDIFKRLLAMINPASALYPSRVELVAGPR